MTLQLAIYISLTILVVFGILVTVNRDKSLQSIKNDKNLLESRCIEQTKREERIFHQKLLNAIVPSAAGFDKQAEQEIDEIISEYVENKIPYIKKILKSTSFYERIKNIINYKLALLIIYLFLLVLFITGNHLNIIELWWFYPLWGFLILSFSILQYKQIKFLSWFEENE